MVSDVTLVVNNDYSPASLDTIASEADTIVVASVDFGKAVLSQDERQIFTDYQVTIQQVLKRARRPGLAEGDTILIRRWGGVMSLEGHHVVAEENDFPPFNASDTYVLFLQSVPNEPFYYFAYGPQGAFHIVHDGVSQVSTKFGNWNRERGSMTRSAFVAEVRRLITGG